VDAQANLIPGLVSSAIYAAYPKDKSTAPAVPIPFFAETFFEEKVKNRWRGRTETNKLVFVETQTDLRGKLLPVRIDWTGPWSMIGQLNEITD
jgi:hypothetical protein